MLNRRIQIDARINPPKRNTRRPTTGRRIMTLEEIESLRDNQSSNTEVTANLHDSIRALQKRRAEQRGISLTVPSPETAPDVEAADFSTARTVPCPRDNKPTVRVQLHGGRQAFYCPNCRTCQPIDN